MGNSNRTISYHKTYSFSNKDSHRKKRLKTTDELEMGPKALRIPKVEKLNSNILKSKESNSIKMGSGDS